MASQIDGGMSSLEADLAQIKRKTGTSKLNCKTNKNKEINISVSDRQRGTRQMNKNGKIDYKQLHIQTKRVKQTINSCTYKQKVSNRL